MIYERKQGRCCWCCCNRNLGVKFVFFWITLAFFIIGYSMVSQYGPKSYPYMIPILVTIAMMSAISGFVFFVPGFNTKSGRYAVFLWWFVMITLAWNIWWWYLQLTNVEGMNTQEWECGMKYNVGS